MQTANWHTSPLVTALMLYVSTIACQRVTYTISGHTIHFNTPEQCTFKDKSSVCVIVLTESIATYGCPSCEWFWQSVDNSNVCSTHPTHGQDFVLCGIFVSPLCLCFV